MTRVTNVFALFWGDTFGAVIKLHLVEILSGLLLWKLGSEP